jgi:glutathione reductase (NADPH)
MGQEWDLLVIGAGSGGLATALRAARLGAKVALFDPGLLGGTCVNLGCVPKKAMWYAAQLAQMQPLAREYGFELPSASLDWERFLAHRQRYVESSQQSYRRQLVETGVHWMPQSAQFVEPDCLLGADGQHHRASAIVIATGARPRRLDVPGFELGLVSDDMFALRVPPRRLAIVGGGYVAVEFAGLMQALGSEVTLFARGRLLASFDAELVHALEQSLQAHGTRLHHDGEIAALRQAAQGIELLDRQGTPIAQADAVLWAVGRDPNTAGLGLEQAGVTLTDSGHVHTDEQMRTSQAGVYAVGDVTCQRALTPVAVAQGRRLAEHLFGDATLPAVEPDLIPSVLFAEPPLATVGLTETAARQEHGEAAVRVYRSRFRPMLWALAERQQQALMKVICVGEEERVVGIHLHGPGVDEMLQGFAVAMRLGLRKRDLELSVPIHPTLSEELLLVH